MACKKDIRQKYLGLRKNFSKDYVKKVSLDISLKLFKTSQYKQAKNIFIYLNFENEIDTKYIIDRAKKDGKAIFCPVLKKEKMQMCFKPITEEFTLNKFGILEPKMDIEVKSDNKTLIIVPSIVYSKGRYRVGYGGGYYDYFLKNNIYMASIGLCYEKFIIEDFEKDFYDKRVDMVITEQNVYT